MRVGTWNLEGRWDERHAAVMDAERCDVWLLTEVSDRAHVDGWCVTKTAAPMARARAWAAIWSRQAHQPQPQPHPASAAVRLNDVAFCSSVLPWRACGNKAPWTAGSTAAKTRAVLTALDSNLPAGELVWGGDWNHSLSGREFVGSMKGRSDIEDLLAARGLVAATADLPSAVEGVRSIDHIAAPRDWPVAAHRRVVAAMDGVRLSDHDAYVVDLQR